MDTPRNMGRFSAQSMLLSAVAGLVISSGFAVMVEAQPDPRSTFPGRRVGGGTRGECSARSLIHLVPETSVYAPDASGLVGILQGPSDRPVSLQVILKPEDGTAESTRTLAAGPASVVLFDVEGTRPVVWETSFNCESGDEGDSPDPMAFVQSSSPPALSLLVSDAEPTDQSLQALLRGLLAKCGSNVPTAETMSQFGFADLVTEAWPKTLPIRCDS